MVTKELFKVGSSFPYAKNITFENKVGGLDLLINYDDNNVKKITPYLKVNLTKEKISKNIHSQ